MYISSWLLKCLVTFWAAVWFFTSVSYFLHISHWLFTVFEKSPFNTNASSLLRKNTNAQNVTRHLSSQLKICMKKLTLLFEIFHVYIKLTAQMSCHILSICKVFHQCELFPAYFKLTTQMSSHILSTCMVSQWLVKHWC